MSRDVNIDRISLHAVPHFSNGLTASVEFTEDHLDRQIIKRYPSGVLDKRVRVNKHDNRPVLLIMLVTCQSTG